MFIDKTKLRELMVTKTRDKKFQKGNYRRFAQQLGIDVAQLHRVLNNPGHKAGPKFLSKIVRYCQKEGLDYNEYIFLEEPLHACNKTTESNLDPTGTD